jgi:two-component system phosphate regulon sensor histidine kinase PhoR
MKPNLIRNIIALATILLIGMVITQVTWVKKAYEIEQKQFSYDVNQILLRSLTTLQEIENDSSVILNPIQQPEPNLFIVKMNFASDPYLVESVLQNEFERGLISEQYELNIYDCFSDSIVYCNRRMQNSGMEENPLHKIDWNKDRGHYFSVHFPKHSRGLFYNMEFWLYSSVILIVIIAFFGYIISQLLKQRRLNQMKTDFINNMTHEFKTPISTISISVDALESPTIAEKPDKLKRYVKIIRLENQRLQEQVERILQAATIEKEKVEIKKHPIDIHEILKKVEKTFKINIESKNGTLQCDLKAANPIIMGDEAHLMNIFNNLIDNAIKYSPENLDISISTRNVNDEIEISISDKGLGISSEHQPFVFDKFYRVPTGNVHDVKGFGIGLNYVNLLVQRHNGKIILRSKKGEGSTFILTFKILKS